MDEAKTLYTMSLLLYIMETGRGTAICEKCYIPWSMCGCGSFAVIVMLSLRETVDILLSLLEGS
jgi:hypothetical protein